jgi:hypothetical protein
MIPSEREYTDDAARTARMTIYLQEKTRKELRIRAIEEGRSATRLVEELILDYLGKQKP